MNLFDEIIEREKQVLYAQRDLELFGFYTLTLIAQEQASKRLKAKLWACCIFLTLFASLVFSPINQLIGSLIAHLSTIEMIDILIMALITYGVAGVFILFLKRGVGVFR